MSEKVLKHTVPNVFEILWESKVIYAILVIVTHHLMKYANRMHKKKSDVLALFCMLLSCIANAALCTVTIHEVGIILPKLDMAFFLQGVSVLASLGILFQFFYINLRETP